MKCPKCGMITKIIDGFSRGRPAIIMRCPDRHTFGKVLETRILLYRHSVESNALRDEYTGSLKSYGYYGDLIVGGAE